MDLPNGNQSFFTSFSVHGYAVALSYSLFAPVERIKVILQTHRLSKVSKADILKRPIEAFKRNSLKKLENPEIFHSFSLRCSN